jgi:carbohydrate-binding DOMON domain-containing protein
MTQHRFVLIFVILGAAISLALFRTQSYIDIPRNETRFTEGKLTINYKEIDTATLESFRTKLNDGSIQVESQFDPTRNNPFTDN